MKPKEIHDRIKESKYKSWQVYLLTASILTSCGLYLGIGTVTAFLGMLEGAVSGWDWLVILGIQGVLIGFVAEGLYDQGDRYAKTASHQFSSKDRTLLVRIGVMTVVSGIITKVVPPVLRSATEYPVLQTASGVIVLGILLVHQGSSDWNATTEWPGIFAGVLLAVAPSIL